MLTLNFGSKQLKDEVKLRRLYILSKKVAVLTLLALLLFSGFFFLSALVLKNNYHRIDTEKNLAAGYLESKEKKLKEIKTNIEAASQVQDGYIPWSRLLNILAQTKPQGIAITSLKADAANKRISLAGQADSRDGLLIFKNNLELNPAFSNISFPLKNISEKTDIYFNIDATFNLTEITK